jgi:hypothetical protein
MTTPNGKSNGIWRTATVALLGVVITLVGAYATAFAGFFHDAVPREELRCVAVKQQDNSERLSRLEGNIDGRLSAIEQSLRTLVQRKGGS